MISDIILIFDSILILYLCIDKEIQDIEIKTLQERLNKYERKRFTTNQKYF